MNAHDYIDQLFAGYEPTAELDDFKEEVYSNLQARIEELATAGRSPDDALRAATAELGDVGEIAKQMSHRREQQVIADVYLGRKVRPTGRRLAAYIGLGAALLVVLVFTIVPLLSLEESGLSIPFRLGAVVSGLIVGVLVYLGCTQETTSNLPMGRGRAIGFGFGGGLVALAAVNALAFWLSVRGYDDVSGAWTQFAFSGIVALIGVGLIIFFGVTQPDRKKPWVKTWNEEHANDWMGSASGERWARFGLFTVAMWLVVIAVFVILGLAVGFQYSWTAFLLGFAAQFLLIAWAMKGQADKS